MGLVVLRGVGVVVLRGDWGGSFEMGWGGSFVKEFVVVVFNSSTNPGGYIFYV